MRPLCSIDSSGCNENPGQPGSGFSFFLFFPPSLLLRRTGSISSSSIGLLSLHYKGSQPERDEEREMETIKQCGKVSQILTIVNQLLHPSSSSCCWCRLCCSRCRNLQPPQNVTIYTPYNDDGSGWRGGGGVEAAAGSGAKRTNAAAGCWGKTNIIYHHDQSAIAGEKPQPSTAQPSSSKGWKGYRGRPDLPYY